MPLVLFDLDGTLVQTARAGIRGMNAAFAQLYGQQDVLTQVPFAGRTDRAILSDGCRLIGVPPTEAAVVALRDVYLDALRVEIARPAPGGFGVLPGVSAVLEGLTARPDVCVALLTGNFAAGAKIKLEYFNLWTRFAFGAFGDDHPDRRDLVPIALTEARRQGVDVTVGDVIVVGDTPLDVDCALAHGARALAVATGPYTTDQLASAGAHRVVGTLAELDPLGAWVDALRA